MAEIKVLASLNSLARLASGFKELVSGVFQESFLTDFSQSLKKPGSFVLITEPSMLAAGKCAFPLQQEKARGNCPAARL